MHPGVLMREILEDRLRLTIPEAARRMGYRVQPSMRS